jgi:hypothetical protein
MMYICLGMYSMSEKNNNKKTMRYLLTKEKTRGVPNSVIIIAYAKGMSCIYFCINAHMVVVYMLRAITHRSSRRL